MKCFKFQEGGRGGRGKLSTNNLKRLVYTALAEFQKNMLWLSISTTVPLDDFILIRYSVIQLVSS